MANFESSVKVIPYSQERVYNKLSDLSNLEAIKDRLPQDKVEDLSFDSDTIAGRAAMMIRSEFCHPDVILSNPSKPVRRPLNPSF